MPKITSGSFLLGVMFCAASLITAADLPANVSADLKRRGCRIAPSLEKNRENVARGEFTGNDVEDWAVLCVRRGETYVLVYADNASQPVLLGRAPFTVTSDPEQARTLRAVDRQYVVIHNRETPAHRFRKDLRCLEVGQGMGSSLYCFVRGGWMTFQGAD